MSHETGVGMKLVNVGDLLDVSISRSLACSLADPSQPAALHVHVHACYSCSIKRNPNLGIRRHEDRRRLPSSSYEEHVACDDLFN